ncbi:MAG: RdgB/HAM1 family non-canonical purine NTP pyrophosphatase [candidate division NC10 bacterium]|nr:RdgB/HAM1 family non-canonical purine NTP pyrophosphatase [candidate division NC10 bacterium]
MDLVIATGNEGKFEEIAGVLADLGLRLLPFWCLSIGSLPTEDGQTFEENAARKARAAADLTGKVALADDSGLEIEALGGMPGIHSARFAGEWADDEERNRCILELLKGVPSERRGARFRCVIAIAEPGGRLYLTTGICQGMIAPSPRGDHGFGYDPIFYLPEHGGTMAELGLALKNQISHRAQALAKAKEILKSLINSRGEAPLGA